MYLSSRGWFDYRSCNTGIFLSCTPLRCKDNDNVLHVNWQMPNYKLSCTRLRCKIRTGENRYFLAKNQLERLFLYKVNNFKVNQPLQRKIYDSSCLPREDREVFSSRVPENLAPSSLGVSVHAWKRFPYLALGAMKNPLCVGKKQAFGSCNAMNVGNYSKVLIRNCNSSR